MRPVPLALLVTVLVFSGCDRTPGAVRRTADERLPALRTFVGAAQSKCSGAGAAWKLDDSGEWAKDPRVLNAQLTCKTMSELGMASQLPPMRPAPPGDKSSSEYRSIASG